MVVTSEIERIVAGAGELPAMPMVAQKVMQMVADESTTPADLQRVIATDPAIASKILKVSNSALFSRVRAITALSHAILILGFSTIRSLVIATSVRSLFLTKSGEFGLKEQMLWEHSLGCGLAARLLADRLGRQAVEASFVGGLLHDIGKVVLNTNMSDVYAGIFQAAYNDGRPIAEVEQERLGFTHAQVGALVVRRWNFSEELEEVLANHHSPGEAARDPQGAAIVHLANLLCERLGIGCRPRKSLDLATTESAKLLGLKGYDLEELSATLVKILEQEKAIFDA